MRSAATDGEDISSLAWLLSNAPDVLVAEMHSKVAKDWEYRVVCSGDDGGCRGE